MHVEEDKEVDAEEEEGEKRKGRKEERKEDEFVFPLIKLRHSVTGHQIGTLADKNWFSATKYLHAFFINYDLIAHRLTVHALLCLLRSPHPPLSL